MSEFTLSKIETSGFRGITVKQEIAFGKPLVLIYGDNRNGKSSIINAIEWCLFGADVAAIKYGIREREAWQVRNLNFPTCYVQCEFKTLDGKILTVKRTYKNAKTSDFFYEVNGGDKSRDEKKLQTLLRIAPKDFISSVHLHPEIVRSLIVAVPKERKDAIDRLLGLSEPRDILEAFATVKPAALSGELDQTKAILDEKLRIALTEKKKTIDSESAELLLKGFKQPDLSREGALRYAAKVQNDLREFAELYHLTVPLESAPANFSELLQFRTRLPDSIQKLRNENPILANQGECRILRSTLEGWRTTYLNQRNLAAKARIDLDTFPDNRNIEQFNEEIKAIKAEMEKLDAEMKEVDRNAAVLDAALAFFDKRSLDERLSCPVCGETARTVAEWRAHIRTEIETKNLAPLHGRKQELGDKASGLEAVREVKFDLLEKADRENAKLRTVAGDIKKAISIPVSDADDVAAVLSTEIEKLDHALISMQEQVEAINSSFGVFQQALLDLDRFQRISKAQQEKARIEAISQSDAYNKLRALIAEAGQFEEDFEILIEGLKSEVRAEAERRLDPVQKCISDTFTTLTNRPDFPGLQISASADGFTIKLINKGDPPEAEPAVPILNHADLNCAALSIFLALAGSDQISHRLGIVILDDPTQSLDLKSKRNLCAVLERLCGTRQVLVATADAEFRSEIRNMHKNKLSYTVSDWTPSGGPKIQAEPISIAHAV